MKPIHKFQVDNQEIKPGGIVWVEMIRSSSPMLYAPLEVTRITPSGWIKTKAKHVPQGEQADERTFTPSGWSTVYYERGGTCRLYMAEPGDSPATLTAAYEAHLAQEEAASKADADRFAAERNARMQRRQQEKEAAIAANENATITPIGQDMFLTTVVNHLGNLHDCIFTVEFCKTLWDWNTGQNVEGYIVAGSARIRPHRHSDKANSEFRAFAAEKLVAATLEDAVRQAVDYIAARVW